MSNTSPLPASIAGLIPGSQGIEAGLQRKFALQGASDQRRQAYMVDQQAKAEANPTQGLHPLPEGDVGSTWGPFMESLKENNATIGGAAGLHTDLNGIHSVPSLDALTNPNPDMSTKTGRALYLQQQDRANATRVANETPWTPAADTSASTAIANLRKQPARGY